MVRPAVPPYAAEPCARPVGIPDRDLTEAEATTHWGRDRKALEACEAQRATAVRAAQGGD